MRHTRTSFRSSIPSTHRSGFGPDVLYLNKALHHVFNRYSIDPSRLAVAGFSDGASYALSLGVANGDLFSHIIAFSPGGCVRMCPRAWLSICGHASCVLKKQWAGSL